MGVRSRLLLLASALLVGWGVWRLILALGPTSPEGLRVAVEVLDRRGRPVQDARVQARYAPGWTRVDAAGRARIAPLRLRADEEPSAGAIAAALDVEAPWWGLPPGRTPQVTPGPDGTWQVRVVLEPYGRLRLAVRATTLPEVRAWLVEDLPLGRIEAEGDAGVARPGQAASWRVFEGAARLEVRLEGASGVAAHRRFVEPPSAGYVREIALDAQDARPIAGTVLADPALPVPDLGGRVEVLAETEQGELVRQAYDATVGPDGTFAVPFADAGRYRLVPHLDFSDAQPVWAAGGDVVTVGPARPRPWLELELAPGGGARSAVYEARREEDAWRGSWTRVVGDRVLLALPSPGRYVVEASLAGDAEHPPEAGRATAVVQAPGPHAVPLALVPLPAGSVRVRLAAGTTTKGASVRLLAPAPERSLTILPALAAEALFPHVRAGPVRVVVTFREEQAATGFLAGEVAADGVLDLLARAVEGGWVVLEGRGAGLATDARDRILRWGADEAAPTPGLGAPPGVATGEIRLRRLLGTNRWEARERLVPGPYEACVLVAGTERAAAPPRPFVVEAGRSTTLPIEVER